MFRFLLLPVLVLMASVVWSADANLDPIIDEATPWERGDRILLIGDSHIQQGSIHWMDQLRRALATKRPELGVTIEARNFGRMKSFDSGGAGQLSLSKPTMVIINVGLSEITVEPPLKPISKDEYEGHLTSVVRQLTNAGILVVLATPIPPEKKSGGATHDPLVAGYAEAVRNVAAANNLELADFRAALEPLGPNVIGEIGVNQVGQNALATVAAKAIAATLDKAPMTLEIQGGDYLGTITVPIIPLRVRNPEKVEIRYSLNGKEPHPKSGTLYKRPIKISTSCTLIAIATNPANGATARAEVRFEKAKGRAPERPAKKTNALTYEVFHGQFKSCKEMMTRIGEPDAKGIAMGPDLQAVIEDETNPEPLPLLADFGLVFTGFVDVPAEGVYTFFLRSSDGSRLFIGDQLVTDCDGLHGAREQLGRIGLREGTHPLRVEYFKTTGTLKPILEVFIDGPIMRKTKIPDMILFHDAAAKPKPRVPAPAPVEEKKDPKKK